MNPHPLPSANQQLTTLHPNNGFTSSENARSITSLSNNESFTSTNSHKYSCRNHLSPIVLFSSSKNAAGILGHSVPFTANRSHCVPPFAHSSQKNPRFPNGVLISHRSPFATARNGRTARYNSSLTRAASSTSIKETLENPRTVASDPGSPTIRDPFGISSEISLSPSPRAPTPSLLANLFAFLRNSPLCRALGDTTIVR